MMMPASSELTQLPEALSDSKLQMGSSWPPMGLSLDVVILEAETSKAAISPHDVPALAVINARVCVSRYVRGCQGLGGRLHLTNKEL